MTETTPKWGESQRLNTKQISLAQALDMHLVLHLVSAALKSGSPFIRRA